MKGSRQERLFGWLVVIVAVHLVGDALVRGVAWASLVEVALAALAPLLIRGFRRGGRTTRTLAAGVLGVAAAAFGMATSVTHAVLEGPGGSDLTGTLSTLAGLVLLGLAFWIALRGRRRLALVPGALVLFALLQWVFVPAVNAGVVAHAPRDASAKAATLGLPGARDVDFPASDGVRLRGWYVPGRNGAAVVLLHGSHGDRGSTLPHLRLLAGAGFGVLAFDARGHGESAGRTNAYGWQGAADVAGAVRFLRAQPGVDPARIGALGLSLGGEEALRAAAEGVPLAAVVGDGAGVGTFGDERLVSHGLTGPIYLSASWLTMRAAELASGVSEPTPLKDLVGRIRAPVLLVASNRADERATDEAFRRLIGPRATVWYVADAGHTKALEVHPAAYAARVTAFLDRALRAG